MRTSVVIERLTDNLIYFAIKAKDEIPNIPGISNVITVVNPDP